MRLALWPVPRFQGNGDGQPRDVRFVDTRDGPDVIEDEMDRILARSQLMAIALVFDCDEWGEVHVLDRALRCVLCGPDDDCPGERDG